MPRNRKPSKHRVLDAQQSDGQHNEDSMRDTVITNLCATDDNVSPLDKLKVLQEMFNDRIEADVVHDVFQECSYNAEQAFESLLELCNTNQYLPFDDNSMLSSATEPSNSSSSQSVIIEVPRIVSEPPISDNTNDNCITQSTTEVRTEKVHNSFALNPQIHHLPISPLNAVMPFANLFSPKHNNSFSSNAKSSHQLKAKKYSLKDEIKSMIQNANQKVLIIMRGLPGSGKSTLAHYLVNGCATGVIISTDHYFTRNGVYNFDPSQLPDAHEWNQKRAKDYIQSGTSPVIIDNTNLEAWEMKPYVSFGHNNGYKIYFLEPDTPWNRNPKELSKKNIHNISKERIENMIYKFANVTVEDVIKSLPTKPLIKSNFVEKVETKSFTETKATTNESLKDLKISLSNIGPSSSNADEDPEECSTSSVSTKPDEVPSSPSQRESSTSQSNDTTEPTSPSSPTCIDIELLLALSERHVDSEDCSSINASEGGSSGISQESGWERDEEFTWSNNNQHNVLNDNDNGYKGFDSTVEPTVDNKNLNEFLDSDPKPKRERKPRNLENKEKCIKEENAEDLEFNEPWDEEDVKNLTKNSNNSFDNGLESSSQTNNNKRMFGLFGIPNYNWEFPPFPINDSNHSTNNTSEISITCYSRQTQTERKDWALLELSQSNKPKEGLETESVEEKENLVSSQFFPNRNVQKVKLHKGTFTNDLPDDMTKAQKLQSLKINFPKAEDSHLNEILDACHENYGWANKLLSEFNDDHFDVATLEQIANESQVSTPDNNSEFDVTKEEELPLESVNQKSSEEPKFVLNLDPNLAAQLELHFGPVSDKSLFNCEDLTVTLSHGVARLLHHNWKKSLNQKPIAQSYPQSSTKISINHNFIDYKSKGLLLEENTPKTEFQEIMDYELAVSLSRQEYDDKLASKLNALGPSQNPKAKELLSTKLKRDQLYLRYPGVDKGFLDEIFESHNYYLGKTIEVIDSSLGENVDFSNETEALIAEERNNSPLNNSRSTSPSKVIRRTTDINLLLPEINSLLTKKKEYHDKAQLAYQRKMFAVASYYGDEASQIFNEIDRLSKQIVDIILNTCNNSNELDLHGLHIAEVNVILSEYLRRKFDELKKSPGKRKLYVDIITGYGATKGVQGRIKPTVIQYLKQKNFAYEVINMGVIRVVLTQQ